MIRPSSTIAPARMRGFERRLGVLEDHLHVAAQRAAAGPAGSPNTSSPRNVNDPGRRLDEPQQAARRGRLAAARLADQAERLALVDGEAHAVDGADAGRRGSTAPGAA